MKRREAMKLGGAALLSSSFLSLLESCKSQNRLAWQPTFLSIEQAQLVSSLVDTILPKTNTPGGLGVKADIFIDLVYKKMYTAETQKKLVDDLNAFNEKSIAQFGKKFHEITTSQKEEFLRAEEIASPKFNGSVWGTAIGTQKPVGFYRAFKSLAIWAYCTSEAIGKNVLKYDPLPGEYHGCVPLAEIGKVWSL